MISVNDLVALTQHPKFVGIGETGLDYHYTADSAEVQKQSLRAHIEAAQRTGLPLIIHARAADDDMARILTEEYPQRTLYLRDALFLVLRGIGQSRAGAGVLFIHVRHRSLPKKPGAA